LSVSPDLRLSDFDYHLPPERIAHYPAPKRDASRLLCLPNQGAMQDRHIQDLVAILRADDVLVFNNTKVIPAQLYGRKIGVDAPLGITLLKQKGPLSWECFAKPARKLSAGDTLNFADILSAEVTAKTADGKVILTFDGEAESFYARLEQVGQMPLPPYIQRDHKDAIDAERYQTVFADKQGAVAAPTAGLHFSHALLAALEAKGIASQFVTLHVGGGTFLPVRSEKVAEHQMHHEWMELSAETAAALNQAKKQGRRIVSVGTTSLRCLESCADASGQLTARHDETGIFITPGYDFKIVDALVTNFHLPKSTLLMLVSAFCGLDRIQAAYTHAIAQQYRFFSYGDACFLERH